MDRKPELEKELMGLFEVFSPKIEMAKDAYQLSLSSGAKKAEVVWPYPLHEVFFDFWENEEKVLSESFEFYEGETDSELIEYLGTVVNRFLENPTRLHTQSKLLKKRVTISKWWCMAIGVLASLNKARHRTQKPFGLLVRCFWRYE